jgi:predicted ATPase
LFVTTHSDILIDSLSKVPEAIIVCEKQEGATTLRRLKAEDLSEWLEKYALGTLWRRGELGGNRW